MDFYWVIQQGFQINLNDLIESCKQYCDTLRYEFLFSKPCQNLNNLIEESFDRLKEQHLLSVPSVRIGSLFHDTTIQMNLLTLTHFSEHLQEMSRQPHYIHLDDDSEDGYNHVSDEITVTLPSDGHGKRVVLTSVLAPYTYTYMAVVRSLDRLRDYGLMEGEFVKVCVQEITNQVTDGRCKYGMCYTKYVLSTNFD